jgi:hypothetical protein
VRRPFAWSPRLYEVLNVAQLGLAAAFQLLLARRFGAAGQVDSYFVAMVVLTTVANLGNFLSEMFLQHYQDLRVHSREDAARLYQAVLTISVASGLALFGATAALSDPLVSLFAWGMADDHRRFAAELVRISAVALTCTTATRVTGVVLNAEMFFALPYVVLILGPTANIAALVLFGRSHGIRAVAVATATSSIAGAVVQQMFVARRLGIRPLLVFWHPRLPELARTSVTVRLGHQLYTLKDVLVTGFLSLFPPGAISLFNYAIRLSRVLFSVANSPALQIFSASTARLVAEQRFAEVAHSIRAIVMRNVFSFAVVSLPFVVALPMALPWIFGSRLSPEELGRLYGLFLATLPYHLILASELPLVQTTIAFKNGALMLRVAVRYLVSYLALVLLLRPFLGIYAVAVGLSLAQLANAWTYFRFVSRRLEAVEQPSPPAAVASRGAGER